MNIKFYDTMGKIARPLCKILFPRSKVIGLENVPAEGGIVICCNHCHWFDCVYLGSKIESRRITYLSPVLTGLTDLSVGDAVTPEALAPLAALLTSALEMAAGLRPATKLLAQLTTPGTSMTVPAESCTISFSGGVADCISREIPWDAYGDLGPILGQAIRRSKLCHNFILGEETIRATVIGAGCHSTQLSGSTVFHQNIAFPLKNLPVIPFGQKAPEEAHILSLPEIAFLSYSQIQKLAETLASTGTSPLLICMEQDMAKALGQTLSLQCPAGMPILCIDRVRLREGDFLDIAAPIGPALPVVVKTLVLSH